MRPPMVLFGLSLVGLSVIVLFLSGTLGAAGARVILPPGTYWNLDAGFGDSELKLLGSGRYTNGAIGTVSVEGTYTVTQNQIVFREYGPTDAPCLHIPASYQWTLNKRILILKQMEDSCATRAYDWSTGQWRKQP